MKSLIFVIVACFFFIVVAAQTDSIRIADSCLVKVSFPSHKSWLQSRYVRESIAPVSLALGSVLVITIPDLKETLQKPLSWNWDKDSKTHKIDLSTWKNGDFLLEDELRYVPVVAAYVASICGAPSQHKFIDKSAILAVSYVMSDFMVHNCKTLTKSLRPERDINSTDDYSLPSQHTAMAFVAATFLDHELGNLSPWISVGGYGVASLVGVVRIANNDHWVSDVLLGAAVGIFTTNASYWAYDGIMKLFHKNVTIVPLINTQSAEVLLCCSF